MYPNQNKMGVQLTPVGCKKKPHPWSEHVVRPVELMRLERNSQIAHKADGILG